MSLQGFCDSSVYHPWYIWNRISNILFTICEFAIYHIEKRLRNRVIFLPCRYAIRTLLLDYQRIYQTVHSR